MKDSIEVDIINNSGYPLPVYETEGATCCDIRNILKQPYVLEPDETYTFPTGLSVAIPVGYEIQVRSRSGLAAKEGIMVLNSPGIIDQDYRGELGVILHNTSKKPFDIIPGMKIAQIALVPVAIIKWNETDILPETKRGSGSFGSTGLK